jgi:hypothetical protein
MALYKAGKADLGKTHLRQALDAKVEFPGIDEARKVLGQG